MSMTSATRRLRNVFYFLLGLALALVLAVGLSACSTAGQRAPVPDAVQLLYQSVQADFTPREQAQATDPGTFGPFTGDCWEFAVRAGHLCKLVGLDCAVIVSGDHIAQVVNWKGQAWIVDSISAPRRAW